MFHYYFVIPLIAALSCELSGINAFRFLPASFKLLLLEGFLSMLTDITCLMYPAMNSEIHNIFVLFDFALIFLAARTLLPLKSRDTILGVSALVFILVWVLSVLNLGFDEFANYAFATGSLIVTGLYLIVLYSSETSIENKVTLPIRLVCLGLILYHTGTFVFILGVRYLMNETMPEAIVDINTSLDTLKYVLIAIAFYLFKRKSLSQSATA